MLVHFGAAKSARWHIAFWRRTFLVFLSLGQKRIEFVNELIVLSTLCACFYR
jgi:hypothetical protein